MQHKRKRKLVTYILVVGIFMQQIPGNAHATAIYNASQYNIKMLNEDEKNVDQEVEETLPPEEQEKNLIGIDIKQAPSKVKYMLGEAFDLSGMILAAQYDDGSEEVVVPDVVSELNPILGEQKVIITYKEFQKEIKVTVTPETVQEISVSARTTTAITFEWKQANGAQEYELYQYDEEKKAYVLLYTTKKVTQKLTNYLPGTTCKFKWRSVGYTDANKKIYSPYSSVFQTATKPEKVASIGVVTNSAAKIQIEWDAVERATKYQVYRYDSQSAVYTKIGTTADLSYTDTKVSSGTLYRYKVRAYTYKSDIVGSYSPVLKTGTLPDKPIIKKVKAGSKQIRVTWNAVGGSSGYTLYMAEAGSNNYKEIAVLSGKNSTTYVQKGLKNGKTYSFKISALKTIAAEVATGAASAVSNTEVKTIKKTNKGAKLYTTKKKFSQSAAYKKYSTIKKKVLYEKSYVIPGLITTDVTGFNSMDMCPQAICFAKNYLLISAYDKKGEENSVLYVMDKKTRKYITTIVLENKSHVGGLAFDEENIWISNGKNVSMIKYKEIETAANADQSYVVVPYQLSCPIKTQSSFMTYYDGKLWIGEYNESASKDVYSYQIKKEGDTITLDALYRMVVPSRTQGLTFLKDGTLLVSRSCQVSTSLKVYISQLEVYKPSKPNRLNFIEKNSVKKTIPMSPMAEGVVTDGNYTYLSFESAAFKECAYPVDRICAFKTKELVK